MKYCRYCSWCVNGNAYYCTYHDQLLQRVDKPVNCSDYHESELGDVDTGRMYTPRPRAKKEDNYSMFKEGQDEAE